MQKLLFISFVALAVSACGDNKVQPKDGEITSSIVATDQTEEEMKADLIEVQQEEEEKARNEANSRTTLKFDKLIHDFGKIKVDTEHPATFVVTNTGSKDLLIEDVATSCGCTTAEKPEKPIKPGQSDKISVVFHPKPGQLKEQKKSITITANTDPKMTVLTIQGFVVE
ncbi:MAG: DUF1573 domain-containing protein [Bacteroidota bacterium]